MSEITTRAYIGKVYCNGSVKAILCVYDGYTSITGRILLDSYTDEAKVDALLELGNLMCLGDDLGTKHDLDKGIHGECSAYGRDGGRADNEARIYPSVGDFIISCRQATYLYLFRKGVWWYADKDDWQFDKLTRAVTGD